MADLPTPSYVDEPDPAWNGWYWHDRAKRAEAGAERVRALHAHAVATNPLGTEFIDCAVCGYVGYVGMEDDAKKCPTVAALDGGA